MHTSAITDPACVAGPATVSRGQRSRVRALVRVRARGSAQIDALQHLRALAAVLVVVYHVALRAGQPSSFVVGGVGVDIFFVVSGCVMWLSSQRARLDLRQFLAHRIARIVPLYWAVTGIYVVIGLLAPAVSPWPGLHLAELLMSIGFVPYRNPAGEILPMVGPGWTLNLEVFFYLIFAFTVIRLRSLGLLLLYLATLAAIGVFVPRDAAAVWVFYTNGMLLEFAAGALVARCWLTRPPWFRSRRLAVTMIGLAVVGLACSQLLAFEPYWSRLLVWGLPALGLVLGLLMLEASGARLRSRLLSQIGDASYSLYLLHTLVIAMVYKFVGPHMLALLAVSLPLACVLAHQSFRHLEKPAARWVLARLLPTSGAEARA